MMIWIVVLAWNNYADTEECLASLARLDYPSYRVLLVDNGSSDGTAERTQATFPDVVILETGTNLGVPGGYNAGFRHALEQGADAVMMLNNDTILDPAILIHLSRAARQPRSGILVPVVYYADKPAEVWSAGARYRHFPPAVVMERRLVRQPRGYYRLEYAIGCCILLTRAALEQAGLLDESFFFMLEDLDLSHRVRQAGYEILQVPEARLWHKVSRTTRPDKPLFWHMHGESGAIYYRRHGRPIYLSMAIHLGYFALREFLIKGRWYFLRPFLRGLRSGIARPLLEIPHVDAGRSGGRPPTSE